MKLYKYTIPIFTIIFLSKQVLFAGYKGEFFIAGLSYVSAIFLSVQASNSSEEYHRNKEMYRLTDAKSKSFAELAGMWDHYAREELAKHGKTKQYQNLLGQIMEDTDRSDKLRTASLNYAKIRDSADEENKKWTNGSYIAAGVGTVFLVKGIISYTRRHKKKKMNIEFQPYPDTLGLQLSYAF